MNTTTNTGNMIVDSFVDFLDRAPGLISFILSLVIVTGYWFLG